MEQYRIGDMEMRFAEIVWRMAPVSEEELSKAVRGELGWKRSGTKRMLKQLCGKGIFAVEEGVIKAKVLQSAFMEERMEGCLENQTGSSLHGTGGFWKNFWKSLWAPVAFEEGDVKGRIKNIMKYRKTAVILSVCAVAVCILAGGLFFTKTEGAGKKGQEPKTAEGGKAEKAEDNIKDDGGKGQYFAWIKKIQDGLLENFQTVSTENLGISNIFRDSDKTNDRPGYAFADLDSDGIYELLLGKSIQEYSWQGIIYGIYGLQDGQVVPVAVCETENDWIYLCKDGTVKREVQQYDETEGMYRKQYFYYKYQDLHLQLLETLTYDDSKTAAEEWVYCEAVDGVLQKETALQESEAYKILNRYGSEVVLLQTLVEREKIQRAREAEALRAEYPNPENLTFADLSGLLLQSGTSDYGDTEFIIKQDGSFEGHFGYSWYEDGYHYNHAAKDCYFHGKFSNLEKTGDYEYTMNCIEFQIEGVPGEKRLEGETLVTNEGPELFQYTDKVCLYLPGMREDALPDGYKAWGMTGLEYGVLTSYALVNIGGEKAYMPANPAGEPVYELDRSKYTYENDTYELDETRRIPKADISEEKLADMRKDFPDKEDVGFSDLKDTKFSNYRIGDTYLEIEEDGSFYVKKMVKQQVFEYKEEYPRGTVYEAVLKGRFSNLRKAGPYKYTMKCNSLKKEPAGKERIEDGRRYITVEEEILGFEKFREFELYLPGYLNCSPVLSVYCVYRVSKKAEKGTVYTDSCKKCV